MKDFFKYVFATFVGIVIAGLVLLVVGAIIIGGLIAGASTEKSVDVAENSVLRINLKNAVPERTPDNPLAKLGFLGLDNNQAVGLNDILADIKKAKNDDNIKGIFLDQNYAETGLATTEEIRNALRDFRNSKKFVIAYGEVYSQSFYYLASVADKVYLNPKGMFDFRGFSSDITFYKGTLDKLGIEAQVIKVGTFKSAVEPFVLTKMSDANRLQVTDYMGSLYGHFLKGISDYRKVSTDSLAAIANNGLIQFPEDAVKYKLVDGLKYKDEVIDDLKHRSGTSKKDNLKIVDIDDYKNANSDQNKDDSDDDKDTKKIAIVYASGEISGGDGEDNSIGSDKISATLRKLRTDDNIKAVVLRVNSPGGSSIASDVIWREVSLTKKVKPIVVSMGDYAASGGYYISCAADSIFAEPNTITGSIGIFAIIPNFQKFFNDKLGLSFDGVKTGKFADLGNVSRPLTPEERLMLQNTVNRGYDDFTKAVADGRHKTQAYINSIGQGRVWTGQQAIKLGLVDKLGNISDAIRCAGNMAKLREYKVVAYPEQKSIFHNVSSTFSDEMRMRAVKSELGENFKYYEQVKGISTMMKVPQARMPYAIDIH